ncbi:MAG: hypothetical protein ACYCUM_04390 [Solirubrobacteraceae bacterium]
MGTTTGASACEETETPLRGDGARVAAGVAAAIDGVSAVPAPVSSNTDIETLASLSAFISFPFLL